MIGTVRRNHIAGKAQRARPFRAAALSDAPRGQARRRGAAGSPAATPTSSGALLADIEARDNREAAMVSLLENARSILAEEGGQHVERGKCAAPRARQPRPNGCPRCSGWLARASRGRVRCAGLPEPRRGIRVIFVHERRRGTRVGRLSSSEAWHNAYFIGGLTWDTMNCETWKSCESRWRGRSARREPSTYLVPGGSIGTMRPEASFAISVAARMIPGSEHEAATAE
eukprot:scaffold49180_cov32-Tisochrysis_lutea.AAC.4